MDTQSKDNQKNTPHHLEDNSDVKEADTNPSPASSDQPQPAKKKSYKKLLIALIVLILVVVIAVVSYLLFAVQTTKNDEADKAGPTHFDSPAAIINKVKIEAEGGSLQAVTMNSLGGMTADGFFAYSTPGYQAAGEKFKTKPLESSGAGYTGDSVTATADYNKFVDFFTKNKFNRTTSLSGDTGYLSANDKIVFVAYAIYESDDMVCSTWHADASNTSLKNHVASVSCAKKDSYAAAAKALQPIFTAYTKANPESIPSDLTFGNPVSKDGTNGYKNAIVYQADPVKVTSFEGKTDFSGAYYLAPNSTDWTFVKSAESVFSCSDFNTDVLKKAFTGVSCYDDTTKKTTTVQ